MILVTGATGNIGGDLVRALVRDGHAVRALSRDADKAKRALGGGVEIAVGDFGDAQSIASALRGVDRAFFVSNAGPKLADTAGAFADAAAAAGVRRIVAISSSTIAFEPPTTIGKWHLALEERVRSTKLAWTFLRPGNFASNALRWAHPIKTQGAVFSTNAEGRSAPIDPFDIAAVAHAALTQDGHEGKTYVLTGSKTTSMREQVEAIGKAIGKPLRVVVVPEEGARKGMLASGMPEIMADAVLELVRATTSGGELQSTHVRDVLGRDARTFDDWLADHVAAFT